MLPPSAIAAFDLARGALATTADFRRAGHHRLEVAAWAREELIHRVLHGLYRLDGVEPPPDQSLHVPIRYIEQRLPAHFERPLLTGQGGLTTYDAGPLELPFEPLVLVDRRSRLRLDRLPFDHRRVDLSKVEADLRAGLPVAGPGRCVADLFHEGVEQRLIRQAVDDLRLERHAGLADLVGEWRTIGHEGSRQLLKWTDDGVFDQESEGERDMFRAVFMAFPPLPDCQVVIIDKLRVDFVFLSAGLIIEYHGRGPHDGQTEHDATRRYALERCGFRTIVVTATMLRDPQGLASFIHSIRRQREHLIAQGALPFPRIPVQPPRRLPLRTLHPQG